MFDDMEEEIAPPPVEKTVDLSVAAGKVEVKTPGGTQVGTPVQRPSSAAEGSSASPSRPSASASGSYSSALKAKPSDWHLEFSIGGQALPLDTTIYGAIHQHESRSGTTNGLQRGVWSGVYTISFKKVNGPAPPPSEFRSPISALDLGSAHADLATSIIRQAKRLPPSHRRGSRRLRPRCPTLSRPTLRRRRFFGSCGSCTRSTPRREPFSPLHGRRCWTSQRL